MSVSYMAANILVVAHQQKMTKMMVVGATCLFPSVFFFFFFFNELTWTNSMCESSAFPLSLLSLTSSSCLFPRTDSSDSRKSEQRAELLFISGNKQTLTSVSGCRGESRSWRSGGARHPSRCQLGRKWKLQFQKSAFFSFDFPKIEDRLYKKTTTQTYSTNKRQLNICLFSI